MLLVSKFRTGSPSQLQAVKPKPKPGVVPAASGPVALGRGPLRPRQRLRCIAAMGSQGDDALYRRILGPMSDRSSDGGQEEGDSGGSHSSSSSSRGTAAADTDSSSPAGGVASCGSAGDPLFAVVARKPAAADDGEDDRRRRTRVGGGDGGITPANVDPGEAADAFVGPALREMDLQLPRGLEVTPAVLERWRLSYNVLMDDARELGIPSSAIPELPATATAEQIRSARDHLRAILASFLSAGL